MRTTLLNLSLCAGLFQGTGDTTAAGDRHFATAPGSAFFELGIGLVREADEPSRIRLKLSREDSNETRPVRRGLARFANTVVGPLSWLLNVNGLTRMIQAFERDTRPLPYWKRIADSFFLKIEAVDESAAREIPREGPVILFGPHPTVGLDGIAIAAVASVVRGRSDVLIVMRDSLKEVPGLLDNAVTVDVSGTEESKLRNVPAREKIVEHLRAGGAIVIFPSGANSDLISRTPFEVAEEFWKPGVYDFMRAVPQTMVVPVFVEDALSDRFYRLGKTSSFLRTATIADEYVRKMDKSLRVHVGQARRAADILGQVDRFLISEHADEVASQKRGVDPRRETTLGFLRALSFEQIRSAK